MRRDGADRGESLLELLVALAIMGLAVVAVVGGLSTSIMMSDIHRKQATAGAYVRDYAEAIQSAGYQTSCVNYSSPSGLPTLPTGYTKTVVSVSSWTGSSWLSNPSWQSSCSDTGLHQVKVQVASSDGRASEQLFIFLRKA